MRSDRAGEEHVPREECAVDRVRDVSRRVPRDGDDVELDPGELERLIALEQDLGSPPRAVMPGWREPAGLSKSVSSAAGACTGASVPSARSARPRT